MKRPEIVIIDYSIGNKYSLLNALYKAGGNPKLSLNPREIINADEIVLPGVGSFGYAIKLVRRLERYLLEAVESKPVLGICLGMQLLFESSTEGGFNKGLGLLRGKVDIIKNAPKLPHMGWSYTKPISSCELIDGITAYFYYAHSYMAYAEEDIVKMETEYGIKIPSFICKKNIYGSQFHPEKGSKAGLEILRRFVSLAI